MNIPAAREDFIEAITDIILENLSDENFGVDELVRKSGISRYKLSKKLHSYTGKNINQFIRETRLQKALEMLRNDDLTISELAYRSGFSSPAYFNKCFHDYFGYPPGQAKLHLNEKPPDRSMTRKTNKSPQLMRYLLAGSIIMASVVVVLFYTGVLNFSNQGSGRPGITVMPFENLTNNPGYDYCESAIRRDLITALAMTGELEVRMEESVNALLKRTAILKTPGYTSSAMMISKILESDFYITGSVQKFEKRIRLDAHMIETKRKIVDKTFEVNGLDSSDLTMLLLIDSLRKKITDYMLVSRIIKKNPYYQHIFTSPGSLEAMKYYDNAFKSVNSAQNIKWLRKALQADSTSYNAALDLEFAYSTNNQPDSGRLLMIRNFRNRYKMPDHARLRASWAYAFTFESDGEQIRYLKELTTLDDQYPNGHYLLGMVYCLSGFYDKAIPELEKSLIILGKWGKEFLREPDNCRYFKWLGIAYHNTGQFRKEKRLYRKAEHYIKGHPWFELMQANLAFTRHDTASAYLYIEKADSIFRLWLKKASESEILVRTGQYFTDMGNYDLAEDYFRRALALAPDNLNILTAFAYFCRQSDIYNEPEIMERAVNLAGDKQTYCEFLSSLGMCLYTQGKYREALDLVQKARDEAPFKVYYITECFKRVKKAASGSL